MEALKPDIKSVSFVIEAEGKLLAPGNGEAGFIGEHPPAFFDAQEILLQIDDLICGLALELSQEFRPQELGQPQVQVDPGLQQDPGETVQVLDKIEPGPDLPQKALVPCSIVQLAEGG